MSSNIGLFVNPKSGFVGIGTSRPATALHVEGNMLASGTITASNLSILGDFVTLNTITSNTEQMVITNAGTGPALKVTQTGANSIAEFYDDGNTLAMTIADGGNVGIGTANPSNKLSINSYSSILPSQMQVSHPGGDWGIVVKRNINDVGTANLAFLKSRGETPTPLVQGDGIGRIAFHAVTNVNGTSEHVAEINCKNYNFNGTNADGGINFSTKDIAGGISSKLDIIPNGNVGIGTTNPRAKLDVNGTFYSPGSVVQIQTNVYSGNVSSTSVSFVDIDSAFGVNITPKFLSSQFLVQGMLHLGGDQTTDARWTFFRLARYIGGSATEVGNGTNTGTANIGTPCIAAHNWGADSMGSTDQTYLYHIANIGITYVDTPNTLSTITYRFRWSPNPGGSVGKKCYINRTGNHGDAYRPNTISTITVMEIAQ